MSWIKKLFAPPKEGSHIKIVELPARLSVTKSDKQVQESVQTLGSHPGFLWLLQRLDVQNAYLKSKLHGERHVELNEVTFLQAGIYWSNWLRQEQAKSIARPIDRQIDPLDEELEAFREIDAQIERVGS